MDTNFDTWLSNKLPSFKLLSQQISSVMENLLQQNNIQYLNIENRTKNLSGIQEKVKRKGYKDPIEKMTDISGIRIVLFLDEDVEKVSNIIRDTFNIDLSNSSNNLQRLSTDRIGYRSTHFVCDVGTARSEMTEYSSFNGLKFEIQVRTILQHAWASLTHDRNYKLGHVLPENIQRKINLYSGMLEIADLGFSEIVREITNYQIEVNSKKSDDLADKTIDSINLPNYIRRLCEDNDYDYDDELIHDFDYSDIVDELRLYDVVSLRDINKLIPDLYFETAKKHGVSTTIPGVIRDFMIITDYNKLAEYEGRSWGMFLPEEDYERHYKFFNEFLTSEELGVILDVLA